MTVGTISPRLAAEQIEHAWELLEDGAALEKLRRSWNVLTELRRDLDVTVVALAREIERLRLEAQAMERVAAEAKARAKAEAPDAEPKTATAVDYKPEATDEANDGPS
jgi:septal ring factor EnvC (AmiA/AmiB activator)